MISCTFENHAQAPLRHVTVDTILLNGKDEICLVKRSLELTKEPGKFCLPGGFLDRDETTAEGAMREVFEETGYKAEVVDLFIVTDKPNRANDDRQNVGFVYIARVTEKVGESDFEIDAVEWTDLDKLDLESVAFDHGDFLAEFKAFLKSPRELPVFIST